MSISVKFHYFSCTSQVKGKNTLRFREIPVGVHWPRFTNIFLQFLKLEVGHKNAIGGSLYDLQVSDSPFLGYILSTHVEEFFLQFIFILFYKSHTKSFNWAYLWRSIFHKTCNSKINQSEFEKQKHKNYFKKINRIYFWIQKMIWIPSRKHS